MRHSIHTYLIALTSIGCIIISACSPKDKTVIEPVLLDPDLIKLESYLNKAGGYQTWRSLDYVQFDLHSIQYDSTKRIISDEEKEYRLGYNYGVHGLIKWSVSGVEHKFVKENSNIQYFIQNEPEQIDSIINNIEKSFLENHFSFGIPFKFMDPNLRRRWVSKSPFDIQGPYDILHVIHEKSNLDFLPSDEQWWVYFDQKTGLIKAYLVFHEEKYYLSIIDDFTEFREFSFPSSYSVYQLDAALDHRFLIKHNQYSNFHLKYLNGLSF